MVRRPVKRDFAAAGIEVVIGWVCSLLAASAGSATILAVITRWWGMLAQLLGDARWPLCLTIGTGIGGLVFRLLHYRSAIYRYDYPSVSFQYEVLSRAIHYRIGPDGLLHYSKTIRIRALQDQVDSFLDRFAWTGGEVGYPVPGRGVVTIDPMRDRAGMWKYFRVCFGKMLSRGEEHEFEVRLPPIADWMHAQPFASMSTDEPTHAMSFRIEIPPGAVAGRRAVVEKLRAVESITPFWSDELAFDEDGRLGYDIVRPNLYHYYRVRWFWDPQVRERLGWRGGPHRSFSDRHRVIPGQGRLPAVDPATGAVEPNRVIEPDARVVEPNAGE